MSKLNIESNFATPDHAYTAIIDAHRNLSDAQSVEFNARLVLILANHIGSEDVLREALDLAGRDFR